MIKIRDILLIILLFLSELSFSQQTLISYLKESIDTMQRFPIYKPNKISIDKEVFFNLIDKSPSFGLAKDNYIIVGVPVNKEISQHSSNIKYQLSIHQRLTKTVLPFNTYLTLTYTQKSFWNVFEKSSPFLDNNYNPAIGFRKPIISNGTFGGIVSFMFEHESNGKDSLNSRSWNYPSLSGVFIYNPSLSFQVKVWYPFAGEDNEDFVDYKGYGFGVLNYSSRNRRLRVSATLNPGKNFSRINTTIDFCYQLSVKANQYLFVQYYNGYAEGMLNYNDFTSMIRIGICIKRDVLTFY